MRKELKAVREIEKFISGIDSTLILFHHHFFNAGDGGKFRNITIVLEIQEEKARISTIEKLEITIKEILEKLGYGYVSIAHNKDHVFAEVVFI